MNLHRALEHEWSATPQERRNIWQKIAAATQGTITPGNVVSVIGLVLVIVGSFLVIDHQWIGVWLLVAGRLSDLVDGLVADKTATKSPVGEAVDATVDKIAAFIIIFAALFGAIMPFIAALYLLAHGLFSLIMYMLVRRKRGRMHPTATGKLCALTEWAMVFCFIVASIDAYRAVNLSELTIVGYALLAVSAVLGTIASVDYVKQYASMKRELNHEV